VPRESRRLIVFNVYDKRLKRPFGTSIYGGYPTACEGGIADALTLFVSEQQIAAFDAIAHLNGHCGLHTMIVWAYQCNRATV
jgi:hypothetical protein